MVLGSMPKTWEMYSIPAVAELGRLDGGVASAIVLAQGPVEGSHGPLDIAGIR